MGKRELARIGLGEAAFHLVRVLEEAKVDWFVSVSFRVRNEIEINVGRNVIALDAGNELTNFVLVLLTFILMFKKRK